VEQIVREKLHNLTATYLGDPDYAVYSQKMMKPITEATLPRFGSFAVSCCPATLPTRERLPLLDDFLSASVYPRRQSATIMDLACALNPFALPWMGLSAEHDIMPMTSTSLAWT
jgi:16S rRNA (guanine(1405)-N(7))-methyltransferase